MIRPPASLRRPFDRVLGTKFTLRAKLLGLDVLTLFCLVLPVVDYVYFAGPEVRRLKLANQTLQQTTMAMSKISRLERDAAKILNRAERYPSTGYLYAFDEINKRTLAALTELDTSIKQEPVLRSLGAAFFRSEIERLGTTREVLVSYMQRLSPSDPDPDPVRVTSMLRKRATTEELHLAVASDISAYLSNLSTDYSTRAEDIQTRLMLSAILYLICAVVLISIRHAYLRRRVLRPISLVHQGQKQIESGLFPGPIKAGKFEPEIQSLVSSFNGMERGIRDFYEYTSILTSATVHDLKEPFSAILSLQNLIEFGGGVASLGISEEDVWGRIGVNCRSGIDLIDNLLQYTRSSLGKIEYAEVNPLPLVKQIFEQAQLQFAGVEAVIKVGVLHSLWCDESQLKTVLRNVIVNAFKNADRAKDQLEINLWTDEFTTQTAERRNDIRLHIRDNGMGFQRGTLETFSDPFDQIDPRDEKDQEFIKGTGSGISICHRILQGHRGSLEARSRPGQGTEFMLSFPTRPVIEPRLAIEPKSPVIAKSPKTPRRLPDVSP